MYEHDQLTNPGSEDNDDAFYSQIDHLPDEEKALELGRHIAELIELIADFMNSEQEDQLLNQQLRRAQSVLSGLTNQSEPQLLFSCAPSGNQSPELTASGSLRESASRTESAADAVALSIVTYDPHLVRFFRRIPDDNRSAAAVQLMSIGLQSKELAENQIDAELVRPVLHEISTGLVSQLNEYTTNIQQIFHASSKCLDDFARTDGALERAMQNIGKQFSSSVCSQLAQTLDNSEFGKLLSTKNQKDAFETRIQAVLLPFAQQFFQDLRKQVSFDEPGSFLNKQRDANQQLIGEIRQEFLSYVRQVTSELQDVKTMFATKEARKEQAKRTPLHGQTYEDAVQEQMAALAKQKGDVLTPTGKIPGLLKDCKKGDQTVELGADSAAPGALFVVEAKANKSYTTKSMYEEAETACKNRGAALCLTVVHPEYAPQTIEHCHRNGHNFIVVWDPGDPATDYILEMTYAVARIATIAEARKSNAPTSVIELQRCIEAIANNLRQLDDMCKRGQRICTDGQRIADDSLKMRGELSSAVNRLELQVTSLQGAG